MELQTVGLYCAQTPRTERNNMTQDQMETLQMLFDDIKDDAIKGSESETKERMEEMLQSLLESATEIQNILHKLP